MKQLLDISPLAAYVAPYVVWPIDTCGFRLQQVEKTAVRHCWNDLLK